MCNILGNPFIMLFTLSLGGLNIADNVRDIKNINTVTIKILTFFFIIIISDFQVIHLFKIGSVAK